MDGAGGDMTKERPIEPRLGVGACIGDAAGRLLLVKRRRAPEAGHWGLPGGKVDFGETLIEAVAREILEELGVVIAVGDLICIVDQIDHAEATHWVAPTYLATIVGGEPSNREPAALEAIGWFEYDNLPSPLTLATQRALEAQNGRERP
jgi:8-oxo-dGTP diphosphatase